MTDSSRCFGWSGAVAQVNAARANPTAGAGDQRPFAAGTAVSTGMSGRRNFAIWVTLTQTEATLAAAPIPPYAATIELRGQNGSTFYGMSGANMRILPVETFMDVLVTSKLPGFVWHEEPDTLPRTAQDQ